MIIKKKSVVVVLISGLLVSLVLILTLIGYEAYLELKNENSIRAYEAALEKIK